MSHIIKLQAKDVGIAKDLFQFFLSADGSKATLEANDAYLEGLLLKKEFLALAALEGNLVLGGLVAYELSNYKSEQSEMYLHHLAVKPEHRQHGIGRQLFEELKSLCRDKGIGELFVLTERYNIAALELLKELGGQANMDSILFRFKV